MRDTFLEFDSVHSDKAFDSQSLKYEGYILGL